MHKKPSGQIGGTRITHSADKGLSAGLEPIALPGMKAEFEDYFAKRFVPAFNRVLPLGPDVKIEDLKQNEEDGLDFRIGRSVADYLVLGEMAPRSTEFGRAALETGEINVYDFSKWIWQKVIEQKAKKYGSLSTRRALLLLHTSYWQFFPHEQLIKCLQSTLVKQGCPFRGVLMLMAGAMDLSHITTIHPYDGEPLPPPRDFLGDLYVNQKPGTNSVNLSDGVSGQIVPFGTEGAPQGDLIAVGGQILRMGPNHRKRKSIR